MINLINLINLVNMVNLIVVPRRLARLMFF
jgi:hypothetical protein